MAGTIPAAGSKVAKGAQVDLIISNGSPQLSYDNGQTISVINPSTGKPSGNVPAGSGGTQVEAAWSPDGTQLVYSQNGQLVLDNPNDRASKPFQLTAPQPGITNLNPSFAPTTKAHIIAFIQRSSSGPRSCASPRSGPFALNSSCTSAPGWDLGGQVDLVARRLDDPRARDQEQRRQLRPARRSTATSPFSTQASELGPGTLQTNDSVAGQGVFAGAFSPNGKKMALVSNIGTGTSTSTSSRPTTSPPTPRRSCR